MSTFNASKFSLNLSTKTYVMGILNVTPDSFSDGGKWNTVESALAHALKMQDDGADIIDVGAQSTRPGYVKISPEEELTRLIPVLQALRGQIRVPISVDTFYPTVAKEALAAGADIINDVTGFKNDKMFDVASSSNCGCMVMHDGPLSLMKVFFAEQITKFSKMGIQKARICLDPGIGFGKSYEENLFVIKNLKDYTVDGIAIMLGASRKRVIGTPCGDPPFEERMPGTIAAHTIAILNGANIIRVHDVKEAVQAAKVADAIIKNNTIRNTVEE